MCAVNTENNNSIMKKAYEYLPTGIVKFKEPNSLAVEYVNENFYNITQIKKSEFSGNFLDIILREDADFVRHSVLKRSAADSSAIEFRIASTDGKNKWVRMTLFNDDEEDVWALISDSTQEHELMSQINDERIRYRFAIGCTTHTIYEYNFEKDLCRFYETSHEQSETGEPNIIKMVIRNYSAAIYSDGIVHKDDMEKMSVICGGKPFDDFEIRQMKPWIEDSAFEWYRVSGHLIYNSDGKPEKVIGTFENINEQKQRESALMEQSQRDTVSKLYNYSTTVNLIGKRMRKCTDGFLALIDIDNFKRINNTYGHLYGDIVISMVADSIRLMLKGAEDDIAGRIGGDEFVVFMNGDDREEIEERIKRLFESISSLTLRTETSDKETPLSCSVGVARRTENTPYYETLFSNADRALYAAKKKGGAEYAFFVDIKDRVNEDDVGYINIFGSDESENTDRGVDLAAACFEILERTKHSHTSMNMLLRQICTSMDLMRISVIEKNDSYTEKYSCERAKCETLSMNDVAIIDAVCKGMVGVVDESVIKRTALANSSEKVMFARLEDKTGYSGILILRRNEEYTESDINTIRDISRVLSVHLGKNKVIEDAEKRFERLINYDPLTGIATLKQMRETMDEYMSTNTKQSILVVYSDFYHFRNMNEQYGFEEGDRVLSEFGQYVVDGAGEEFCVCARISGDEFASAAPYKDEHTLEMIQDMNEKFCAMMNRRYPQANIIIRTGAYILKPGEQFIAALYKADMARKSLNNLISSSHACFDEKMSSRISLEAEMARTMRDAVKNREFVVYFQPKVSLENNKIIGAEALVRWIRPDGSIMGPNAFVPYFERNGFITNVDFCIYEQVMELLHEWNLNGIKNVPVSVNMSRLHGRDVDVAAKIRFLMEKYSIPPEIIEFEVTETALASCDDGLKKCINTLHDMGILINIDDFGSGYSSLNLLTEVPADIIKLDKMMITESISSPKKAEIIRYTVRMAEAIDYDVICEGVETYQEVEFLKSIGCKKVQGYYFSKPVESKVFRQMLIDDKPLR